MVGVAQLVEHSVVVRDVAGSSPVAHPTITDRNEMIFDVVIEIPAGSKNKYEKIGRAHV